MTTMLLDSPPASTSDAELVAASRGGDRAAFGRIVRRYQGMVTGVIYAACGDLHRSEDLAQDTFISAWRSLSGLRDASKLPAWLCQVARHRVLDDARSSQRQDARLAKAFHDRVAAAGGAQATEPSAEEQLLSAEERELLWHTLRDIPQPYRETLVLYYRQGKSAADVALAMETTEGNVRQRLARGREMLREHVAAMLERNLARSAPGAVFAAAVVAALPALIPQSASAAAAVGTAATAAKGAAAAAKGTGLLALVAMWIGPIMGVAGGAFGTWMSIRNAEHPRERKFVISLSVRVWIFVLVAMAALFGLMAAQRHFRWSGQTFGLLLTGFWATYLGLLLAFLVASKRRHTRLRAELGLPSPAQRPLGGEHGRWFGFAGATVGALSWMFGMALQAKDTTAAMVVAVVAAIGVVACRFFVLNRTIPQISRFAVVHVLALGAFTLVMVNWRMHAWIAASGGISVAAAQQRIPLWTLNLFTCVLIGLMLGMVYFSLPKRSPETPAAPERQN